jgi:hypothetical protein
MRRAVVFTIIVLCLGVPAQAIGARGPTGTAERLTERAIRDLNGVLAGARDNLAELAGVPSVQSQDAAACATDSQGFADSRYTGAGAASLDGNLYCFSSGLTGSVNIADRAYFLRTVGTLGLGVGDYQIGRASGIDSIGLGYPVFDGGGKLTGVTISPLSLPWLERRVARQASGKSVDNLVLDDHGTVLSRIGRVLTPIGTNLGRSKLTRAMLEEDFGHGTFKLAGERVAAAWGVVPLSDGEIHLSVSVPR